MFQQMLYRIHEGAVRSLTRVRVQPREESADSRPGGADPDSDAPASPAPEAAEAPGTPAPGRASADGTGSETSAAFRHKESLQSGEIPIPSARNTPGSAAMIRAPAAAAKNTRNAAAPGNRAFRNERKRLRKGFHRLCRLVRNAFPRRCCRIVLMTLYMACCSAPARAAAYVAAKAVRVSYGRAAFPLRISAPDAVARGVPAAGHSPCGPSGRPPLCRIAMRRGESSLFVTPAPPAVRKIFSAILQRASS